MEIVEFGVILEEILYHRQEEVTIFYNLQPAFVVDIWVIIMGRPCFEDCAKLSIDGGSIEKF